MASNPPPVGGGGVGPVSLRLDPPKFYNNFVFHPFRTDLVGSSLVVLNVTMQIHRFASISCFLGAALALQRHHPYAPYPVQHDDSPRPTVSQNVSSVRRIAQCVKRAHLLAESGNTDHYSSRPQLSARLNCTTFQSKKMQTPPTCFPCGIAMAWLSRRPPLTLCKDG